MGATIAGNINLLQDINNNILNFYLLIKISKLIKFNVLYLI